MLRSGTPAASMRTGWRRQPVTGALLLAGAVGTCLASLAHAQVSIAPGVRVQPPARSMKDLRDQFVVKQRFDFSCGAAALATLMNYGFGEDVTEAQILVELFDLPTEAEREERRRTGFSLLDMQRVAEALGYDAQGFRLEPDQLSRLGGPVIVFIEPRGYKHFAVLRGVVGNRVHLADPSLGQTRQPMFRFLDAWRQDDGRGIIFAIQPRSGVVPGRTALDVLGRGRALPEVMSVRELIAVRGPLTASVDSGFGS